MGGEAGNILLPLAAGLLSGATPGLARGVNVAASISQMLSANKQRKEIYDEDLRRERVRRESYGDLVSSRTKMPTGRNLGDVTGQKGITAGTKGDLDLSEILSSSSFDPAEASFLKSVEPETGYPAIASRRNVANERAQKLEERRIEEESLSRLLGMEPKPGETITADLPGSSGKLTRSIPKPEKAQTRSYTVNRGEKIFRIVEDAQGNILSEQEVGRERPLKPDKPEKPKRTKSEFVGEDGYEYAAMFDEENQEIPNTRRPTGFRYSEQTDSYTGEKQFKKTPGRPPQSAATQTTPRPAGKTIQVKPGTRVRQKKTGRWGTINERGQFIPE